MTAREIIMEGNEGYQFRDVIDNLTEQDILDCMEEYAKQQQGYSEEEVEDIAKDAYAMGRKGILIGGFNKWFEQFKKK